MEANKARNMIIHRDEIQSRPPRVWFKAETEKSQKTSSKKSRKEEKLKKVQVSYEVRKFEVHRSHAEGPHFFAFVFVQKMEPEELKAKQFQEFLRRDEKRKNRKKRLHAFPPDEKDG